MLVHAITAFGIGGLVGGLAMTWWQRRAGRPAERRLDSAACDRPARLVVLVSGSGTNLQALLDACADPAYGAGVVAVGADRDDIEGLARAERAGIPTFVHEGRPVHQPRALGRALADTVAALRARPRGARPAS